ncbi:MAG: TRAP transporter permease [Lautropia sp.]|nr:MAG: TRAP transporter permease [Pseudomonadota bacterium]MBC6960038.1 TRAP transporter permease [Lautropia sp.]MCL4701947.1 TRAP transporter permease [Burkholderiaceae bacterium]MCZ2412819.1 TRAP transporter permease [Burkholderiales bacterium]MDL1907555.1 TRAP transporter permease [Betaproteobacteria bacterium PRO1]
MAEQNDSASAGIANPVLDDPHNVFGPRSPAATRAIFWIAVAFSAYQVYTAAYAPLSSIVMRALHVGFLLLLTFAALPTLSRGPKGRHWPGWTLAIVGFGLSFYQWIFEQELIMRSGELTTADLWVGIVMLALVFEATRRVMGPALPIICGLFLAYALFGQYLPGGFGHRGYGLDQVINQMSFGTEGIYGIPTYVSSTYIFLFILFGTFLEQAGMIRLFTDFSLGTVGHTRGGPAKVSVVASGLMGTINGSGVANVVTTGQFTIPLMKRFGFSSAFAGGVEATSSMGGQIMPPVMGAVAFIMAETIGVPYVEVVKAAVIPAFLYFATAFWMVHLEAGRLSLMGMRREDCPDPWAAVREKWYLILPLATLVWLLFAGYTPLFSGTVGLAATVILIFGAAAISGASSTTLRVVFWIGLGLVSSSFLRWGITAAFVVIAALIAVNFFVRGGRDALRLSLDGMAEGAKNALSVGVACALVGVIIGVMTLTGAATAFGGYVIALGEHSLFLSLVLTMLTCLVLGMGIPTIPNYIITSSLAAPALLEMGVPLIVSHMFVFYFGIMADLTPPVALAAFAASPIARESGLKIGMQAMRIAIAGFVVPYMAVYAPALMMQSGSLLDTAYLIVKALLAIGLWGAATVGYLQIHMTWYERLLSVTGAFLLVVATASTDELGFAICVLVGFIHWWRQRRAR